MRKGMCATVRAVWRPYEGSADAPLFGLEFSHPETHCNSSLCCPQHRAEHTLCSAPSFPPIQGAPFAVLSCSLVGNSCYNTCPVKCYTESHQSSFQPASFLLFRAAWPATILTSQDINCCCLTKGQMSLKCHSSITYKFQIFGSITKTSDSSNQPLQGNPLKIPLSMLPQKALWVWQMKGTCSGWPHSHRTGVSKRSHPL